MSIELITHGYGDTRRQDFSAILHTAHDKEAKIVPSGAGQQAFVAIGGDDELGNEIKVYLLGDDAREAHRVLGEYLAELDADAKPELAAAHA